MAPWRAGLVMPDICRVSSTCCMLPPRTLKETYTRARSRRARGYRSLSRQSDSGGRRTDLTARGRLRMTRKLTVSLCTAVVVLLFAGPMFAHHGAAAYDTAQTTTLKGTVVDFEFINPHCQLFINVADESGNPVKW